MQLNFEEAFMYAAQLAANGQLDDAESLLRQMHAAAPGVAKVSHGLGVVLASKGQLSAAAPLLFEAVQHECTAEFVFSLVCVLGRMGAWAEIDRVCRAARNSIGGDPRVLSLWGSALNADGRAAEAELLLRHGLTLCTPEQKDLLRQLHHYLGTALIMLRRGEEAVKMYGKSLLPWSGEERQDDIPAQYALLAPDYDKNEVNQSFTIELVALYQQLRPSRAYGRVLELGCGTGLLSTRLSDWETLVGIDLSPAMLTLAKQRTHYDELHEGDLVQVMDRLNGSFDTIFSACVLYHSASLSTVFERVGRKLASGGMFIFSVDSATDEHDIGVSIYGQYGHSRAYLRRLAAENGLTELGINIGRHRGPPGFFCAFGKA